MIATLLGLERAKRARLPAFAAALILAAGAAWACPICFSGRVPLLGPKIDAADEVVLATQIGEAGPYRVTTSIKGAISDGAIILDASPAPPVLVVTGRPSLVVRNRSSQQWSALGSMQAGQADWLRAFAAGAPAPGAPAPKIWPRTLDTSADLSDEDWLARLALVAPVLESPDRLVAEIAYGELARAPYRLLRSLKGMRSPAEVLNWLADPDLLARKPGYLLLLGVAGGDVAARYVAARLAERRAARRSDDVAALITADLEMGGPASLGSVIAGYLTDSSRGLPEIEAALLALNVQGTADAAIPRAQIVAAYGDFVRAHPAMAGFVVQDLSDWGAFDVADVLQAALESGAVRDPGSRYAVQAFLQRDPARPSAASNSAGGDLPP
ncbi:MAG: hypothetical protein U1E62_22100 [Alsobacter sp.]